MKSVYPHLHMMRDQGVALGIHLEANGRPVWKSLRTTTPAVFADENLSFIHSFIRVNSASCYDVNSSLIHPWYSLIDDDVKITQIQ